MGSSLIKALEKSNVLVIAGDIAEPSKDFTHPFERLDVCDQDQLKKIVCQYKIDTIFNLPAILSAKGEQDPMRTWAFNISGFQHVAQVAIETGVSQIFWPSSIAVFGVLTPKVNTTQLAYTNPKTMYGVTKLAGERLMEYYKIRFGLDIRSLRYPGLLSLDAFSGGGTTDYIIELIRAAKNNEPYRCFLNANTTLPMMHMDDAVRATLSLMKAPLNQLKSNVAYNISGFSTTPSEVVEVIKTYGLDVEVFYQPDYRQAIADSWPKSIDDSYAQREWGWVPKIDLKTAVRMAMAS